jgi:hypothetical protein
VFKLSASTNNSRIFFHDIYAKNIEITVTEELFQAFDGISHLP